MVKKAAQVVAAVVVIAFVSCRNEEAAAYIFASGTLEAVVVRLSPTVGGQVIESHIAEGRKVEKGEVLVRIDDRHHRNQIAQAEAAVALAEAHLKIVRLGARKEDIEALKQQVRQAEEALFQARKERDRARALVEQDGLPRKVLEDAETLTAVREAGLKAAKEMLQKARRGARPEEIEAAEAQKAQAEAALKALKDRLDDYAVKAPISGTILVKAVEEGEVVGPGQTLATIADLSILTVRLYVPEKYLGRVRLGQDVILRADSYPDRQFSGKITFISSEAEFTPKNIQTKDERVKMVYAVKVSVENPEGLLKVGMPVDAEIPIDK